MKQSYSHSPLILDKKFPCPNTDLKGTLLLNFRTQPNLASQDLRIHSDKHSCCTYPSCRPPFLIVFPLKDGDRGSYNHFLVHKRATLTPIGLNLASPSVFSFIPHSFLSPPPPPLSLSLSLSLSLHNICYVMECFQAYISIAIYQLSNVG